MVVHNLCVFHGVADGFVANLQRRFFGSRSAMITQNMKQGAPSTGKK